MFRILTQLFSGHIHITKNIIPSICCLDDTSHLQVWILPAPNFPSSSVFVFVIASSSISRIKTACKITFNIWLLLTECIMNQSFLIQLRYVIGHVSKTSFISLYLHDFTVNMDSRKKTKTKTKRKQNKTLSPLAASFISEKKKNYRFPFTVSTAP